MAKRPAQGSFNFVGWGGKRRGAGRKSKSPAARRRDVPHRDRLKRTKPFAAHVTLRLGPGLPSLRDATIFPLVVAALTASAFGLFCRIVEFSVQKNHLHLLVEANDSISLAAMAKALSARIATSLNAHLRRRGHVFDGRYHVRVIETPREARNAYVYVLGNARKHAQEAGVALPDAWIDPYSSGGWFDGWRDADLGRLRTDAKPVARAQSWLLRVGWRKFHPLISVREAPQPVRVSSRAAHGRACSSSVGNQAC